MELPVSVAQQTLLREAGAALERVAEVVVVLDEDRYFPTHAQPCCSYLQIGADETASASCGDNGHNAGKLRHRAKAVRRIFDKRQDR